MKIWLCMIFGFFAGTSAIAQSTSERLSTWILRQGAPLEYPIGLQWQVPQERAGQSELKRFLLESLQEKAHAKALSAWIEQQAVTGRVILRSSDARWLEANPSQNPLITPDQKIVAIPRPSTVTVLMADGSLCQVFHASGATAKKYVETCTPNQNNPRAWIAQPDGRVSNFGIAQWNAQEQDEMAPGAWVWAPDTKLALTDAFSDGLIRFVASLGAAADSSKIRSIPATIQAADYLLRSSNVSANDWGEIGLIQTPSARMAPASTFRFNLSKVLPYTRYNVMFQPIEGLEAGFRYTDIGNQPYDSTGTLQTAQTFKDKSFDFKLRLKEESTLAPAVALGMRDIGGTGLFSSEYFVASKRFGDFDASLGIGWGYIASSGNISNPFGKLNSSFYTRPSATTANGGEVSAKAIFRGPAGLFGGVQWKASDTLTYKVEREANDYQTEPFGNSLSRRSPWNFAANYKYSPDVDFSVGLERGNKLMFGLSLQTNLDGQNMPKLLQPSAIRYIEGGLSPAKSFEELGQDIFNQTGWDLIGLEERGSSIELRVRASAGIGAHRRERMDRLNALMQAYAGQHIRRWSVVFIEAGLAVGALEVDRDIWIARQTQLQPPSLQKNAVSAFDPSKNKKPSKLDASKKDFTFNMGPSYDYVLGGPDAFYLYSLGVAASASYHFAPSTWMEGSVDYRVLDNFDRFKYTGPSNLPRVRTYAREYKTTSHATLPLLQVTHVGSPATNIYASVYGGMLESMFSGVGTEWLYRPLRSSLAVGIDVNRVYQRDFRQNFALRDYSVNTGHATAYWDTGFSDILLKLQVGQYLAGDRGATVSISRAFDNGTVMGAYATKTNVSAAQFGEGSFDKGVYVSIPFDVILLKYSERSMTVGWKPLTRDGGAQLSRANSLYALTLSRDRRTYQYESVQPARVVNARMDSETYQTPLELRKEVSAEPLTSSVGRSITYASKQLAHPQSIEPWLWGGAAVFGASLLDRRADTWAQQHANLNGVAKLGNAIPLYLGVGALATSLDDGAGMVALKSAGITIAASTVLRTAVGRSRPEDGLGNSNFRPFSANSVKSGFPSNHVSAAFALATPLAQNYDMPWLYGLGVITAIGRVQGRAHWLSDTVAGGVLGYAVGAVLSDEYRERGRSTSAKREVLASPNSLAMRWLW